MDCGVAIHAVYYKRNPYAIPQGLRFRRVWTCRVPGAIFEGPHDWGAPRRMSLPNDGACSLHQDYQLFESLAIFAATVFTRVYEPKTYSYCRFMM